MVKDTELGSGLRYDSGKNMHELFPAWAMDQISKVYTKGAAKYAPNNWRKGMPWNKVLGPLKRHLNAFEMGNDFDFDPECTGCQSGTCTNHLGKDVYHLAELAWNAITLLEYYKIYPQGDNRPHGYLSSPKIGLDIDEVLADWVGAWMKYWKIENRPKSWFFDRDILAKFESMKKADTLEDFYLNLECLTSPKDIPFEPHCYITSRPCSKEITELWLDKMGFPARPVYAVELGQSKIEVAKNAGIDIFVDDRYDNFVELNKNGITTYLFDSPHNQRYDVGYRRIKSLKELKDL